MPAAAKIEAWLTGHCRIYFKYTGRICMQI
jgi:hypothetical protein